MVKLFRKFSSIDECASAYDKTQTKASPSRSAVPKPEIQTPNKSWLNRHFEPFHQCPILSFPVNLSNLFAHNFRGWFRIEIFLLK